MIDSIDGVLGRFRSYLTRTVVDSLATFGRAIQIAAGAVYYAIVDIATRRFSWRECVKQTWFIVTVTATPTVLVSIPFGVIVAAQVGSLTQQVGATSVSGAAGGLGVIQQGAPIVAALLLGGAAGAAVASDLGARAMREEIDALRAMGINPVRRLVAPRIVAMVGVAPLICFLAIIMGVTTGYFISIAFMGVAPGSYLSSFASFSSMTDVVIAVGKSLIFGLVVAVVACQRGMETKHGAKAVADSVNAAVVVGVVAAFGLNMALTQVTTMFFPMRSIV
ncbi:MlaE family ABC transporter permease [Tsukamurella ocularis]|uniref:MlaE family ABC transporter permease n=1 Tax=Tsukamurella ocularis TaxID=1970234 RepID=UPI002169BE80|nr:ABC transporter permease [Tsukamurella ocularis]MCS3778818.1 phospholipid/cholesterol/gamma-HCH transport system permease protein [Tsukamurella ocularis]MCS3787562.1 phospholipid/cholesterol/gamma-HCH transport system permease protein [Tsukamurella ocularis]MCS3851501.1 phospholipid/cholesterol/gamma-HCH transport system permease protein [Tsukamurella ocularis]